MSNIICQHPRNMLKVKTTGIWCLECRRKVNIRFTGKEIEKVREKNKKNRSIRDYGI